jgi:hypothetical protein
VQRLCDTGLALRGTTDTRADTGAFLGRLTREVYAVFIERLMGNRRDGGTGRRSGLKIVYVTFHHPDKYLKKGQLD